MLALTDGTHPYAADPQAETIVKKDFDDNNNSAIKYYRRQLRLLALGVAFFIAWHVTEMAKIEPEAPLTLANPAGATPSAAAQSLP